MEELKQSVEKLVGEELKRANKKFPMFNSRHEGYAVILEEKEEVEYELRNLNFHIETLWTAVKYNTDKFYTVETIKEKALLLASEAIQVAAMAQKYIDSLKVE